MSYYPVHKGQQGEAIGLTYGGSAAFESFAEAKQVCELFYSQNPGVTHYKVMTSQTNTYAVGNPDEGWFQYVGRANVARDLFGDAAGAAHEWQKIANWG